jgi:hypothetical protein
VADVLTEEGKYNIAKLTKDTMGMGLESSGEVWYRRPNVGYNIHVHGSKLGISHV